MQRTLGHGVGLRTRHYERALRGELDVDWVEVISENFFGTGPLGTGGRPRAVLERLREQMPVVLHGVSLGIGGVERPDPQYLEQLKRLAAWVRPAWISDHLCWTRWGAHYSHDLLPLPFTDEALSVVVRNVNIVQEALKQPLTLENVSSYLSYNGDQRTEWQFLTEVCAQTGAFILLDLNNIVVSARNHGFNADDYLDGISRQHVRQLHLANHTDLGHFKFDSHAGAVPEEVWGLYRTALHRFGPVATCVEWDEDVPEWEVLRAEQQKAMRIEQDFAPVGEGARLIAPAHDAVVVPAAVQNAVGAPLARVQELLWHAITAPCGVKDFLAHADGFAVGDFERLIAQTPEFDRVARADVYANAYFARLLGVLAELFPEVQRSLGAVPFHNLITDYLLACPSTDADVRRIGDRLPDFLRDWQHPRAQALAELADIELAVVRALDCGDAEPLKVSDLGSIPEAQWPALRFRLHPSVAVKHGVLVWRAALAVQQRALESGENAALLCALRGDTFEQLCAAAANADAGFQAHHAAQMIARWLGDGLITGVGG